MRRILIWTAGGAGVLLVVALTLALLDGGGLRLPVQRTDRFTADVDLPALRVDGRHLVTADGTVLRLRGVMPPDPVVLADDDRFRAELFEEIAATGATVVRIAVHPRHWIDDPDYLWRYVDPAVRWAGEAGLYAIVDWHSIGNVRTGRAPHDPDLYAHTEALTREFWAVTARHFADAPHVLFEVFNEPQGITADEWRSAAEELVRVIRDQGADQPVIVGGVDYGRDLSWVLADPVDDPAVVYASHIYPVHAQARWPHWFGDVAARHPVLLTEWGFTTTPPPDGQDYLVGSAADFGEPFLAFAQDVGAGWVACWWDDSWQPALLRPGNAEPTDLGRFVLDALATP